MTTKWMVRFGNISAVEIERETESSVWIKGQQGRRRARASAWEPLFDTEREAWAFLLNGARGALEDARRRVKVREKKMDELVGKLPDELRDLLQLADAPLR